MHKFFVESCNINDDGIVIVGQDVKHIKNVLRMTKNDVVIACDNQGMEYNCSIKEINNDNVVLTLISKNISQNEPKTKVTLYQGIPKGEKMEFIIQKAVELGINSIIPVTTTRTVVKINKESEQKKIARWNRIAMEASKQSGRDYIPEVKKPIFFEDIQKFSSGNSINIIPYEKECKKGLKDLFSCYNINSINTINILIGPEGGFSEEEIEKAKFLGFDSISLGRRILRTETAAITTLSIIMYEMGELQYE